MQAITTIGLDIAKSVLQSVVSRYLISTTGIAQHHAVAATHMDAFAEIIRSHARFSSNPDLITSRRASATFQQDRVPPCQHRRMALLERSISIQHLGARHVAAEDHAPRLHRACDDTLFKRRNEDVRPRALEQRVIAGAMQPW